jgi:hypothetical protein
MEITKGTTDVSVWVRVIDSTDGTPETSVAYDTAGIDLWYQRAGATHVSITEATQTENGAHSDGGFVHVSDGYCRLDLPDAACATGVDRVLVGGTVTGMIVIGCQIDLIDANMRDGVRAGLTALPNAAADAAGGLPISDAGGLDLDTQIGTDIDAILADTNELQTDDVPGLIAALDTVVDRVEADTQDLQTQIGTDGAGLTSLPWNAAWDAEVQSEVADGLAAYDPPTRAELTSDIGTVTTAISGLNDPTAAAVADAVWDEAQADHVGAGTMGEIATETAAILVDTGTTLPAEHAALPTAAENRAEMDSNSTQLSAIVADTNEMQGDLANGGRLDLLIDAILEDTGTTLSGAIAALNDLSAADVNAEVVDVLSTDTQTLPGQTAPPAAPTLVQAITWLYKFLRNKKDNDGSTTQLYDDAGTTVDAKQTTSESGGTVTVAEIVTGP